MLGARAYYACSVHMLGVRLHNTATLTFSVANSNLHNTATLLRRALEVHLWRLLTLLLFVVVMSEARFSIGYSWYGVKIDDLIFLLTCNYDSVGSW